MSAASGSQAQVRRLLSLVPYLMEHDGAKVTEVAEAFGVSPARLREDLNVLWMCGLPGLAPGDLIEVDMDAVDGDGVIHLSNADYLTRPLRLTADEALALTLALRTLRGLVGTGDREAIDSALAKLAVAAGERACAPAPALVSVTSASEAIQATISEGLSAGRRLDLTYDVASRAETTRRLVDPLRMYVLDGYGYLDAWCWSAGALRSFRLDRVAAVELTDHEVADHDDVVLQDLSVGWFDSRSDAPLVTVALAPTATWVAEYYPMEQSAPAADGGLTVTLRVADPAWFRGLLLRLGGAARVLAPAGAEDEAVQAAREALEQYAALAAAR
ncbi:MAG: helix-turn-helix transcriptional regulator [Propionibacteriaceae bacterium]